MLSPQKEQVAQGKKNADGAPTFFKVGAVDPKTLNLQNSCLVYLMYLYGSHRDGGILDLNLNRCHNINSLMYEG